MTAQQRWFDRSFELGLGADAAPEIVARLADAPERLAAAVAGLSREVLTQRHEGKWSIQENAGHLCDLEELWDRRLDDYETGAATLHPADLENRRTHQAGHNERPISEIVTEFRTARAAVVEKLARMTHAELERSALHPRLQQPMSVVDLCFFVAEHDDHHLTRMAELRDTLATPRTS